jgi:hypothetical protein
MEHAAEQMRTSKLLGQAQYRILKWNLNLIQATE